MSLRGKMVARILLAIVVLALVGAGTMLVLSVGPNEVRPNVTASGASPPVPAAASGVNRSAFADGMGVYLVNDGKYIMLVWKKKLVAPPAPPEEKDMLDAFQQATQVKKGVRFFTYGADFSKWPTVPPYIFAFCVARDLKTIDGIFPIRLKLVDEGQGPIYELLLPPIIDALSSGAAKHLFWAINFQYSCNDGWTFRFQ